MVYMARTLSLETITEMMITDGVFAHEIDYRGNEILEKLRSQRVMICGAGALGSNIALALGRFGVGLVVVDRDKVEMTNLPTQTYTMREVGSYKVNALADLIYRIYEDKEPDGIVKDIKKPSDLKFKGIEKPSIIVDCFDNSKARSCVKDYADFEKISCLHVAFNGGYCAIRSSANYTVPDDGGEDICDYPLSLPLLHLAVAATVETIINYIDRGVWDSIDITLKDMRIQRFSHLTCEK